MADLSKDERINKEIKAFKKFIKDLEKDEQAMAMNLIKELGFMKVTMQDLKEEVNTSGVVTEMPQGDYSIMRENPALKSYNTMIQRYNATLKQLDDFIKQSSNSVDAEIDLLGQFLQKK